MKSNYLFILESPFQMLQAIELINQKKIIDFEIVIRKNSNEVNNSQIVELVKLFTYEGNCRSFRTLSFYSKASLLLIIFFKAFSHDKLVFGDSNSYLFRFIKFLFRKKKFLLLDDGVATINDSGKNYKYQRFTIFNCLQYKRNNEFQFLSSFNANSHINNLGSGSLIVGTKAVEEGILTKNVYHKFISDALKISREFSHQILYIPHRGESDENIKEISAQGLRVYRPKYPIELIGYELCIEVKSITSLFSTALYSMAIIYPSSKITAIELESNLILKRRQSIEQIYKHLNDSENISIVNLSYD